MNLKRKIKKRGQHISIEPDQQVPDQQISEVDESLNCSAEDDNQCNEIDLYKNKKRKNKTKQLLVKVEEEKKLSDCMESEIEEPEELDLTGDPGLNNNGDGNDSDNISMGNNDNSLDFDLGNDTEDNINAESSCQFADQYPDPFELMEE